MKKFLLKCVLLVLSLVQTLSLCAQTATYDPSVFIDININTGNPTTPFPQFLEYPGGGKSLAKYNAEGVTHADMEKTLREAYEIMMHRCRYEGTYCGVKYISFNRDDVAGNYGTFVSEGDGYALLAAAIFADQKTFNGLYMWVHDIRFSGVERFRDGRTRGTTANDYAGPYLAAWKDKTFDAAYGSDSHSATDGDVDIAMAMLIAYKQWGEWMMQDGQVVKDSRGNPISLKYEAQRVVGALVDTLGQWDKGSGALTGMICGVVGIDGYEKRGNSWGELTRWRFTNEANALYPGVNGPYNTGPNLMSIYGGNYIDYDAPSYFEEFWRWLKNGDGVDEKNSVRAPWEIHQFKRAAASGNWLNQQAYNQGYNASIGQVQMNTDGSPTFGVYVDGEDFRYCWRHVLDYLWHGDADYDWDPKTHQVIEGQTNNSERLMGARHAKLLENPSNSGTQLCSKMGASPDPGQPLWFGVSQIPQQWRLDGGITSAYHTNYSVGAGATAAVASENLSLISDIYRQCELMWDGNNTAAKLDPEERYIGSTPKYFHGWFRTLGMLVCSGNLLAPETMVPKANMKVYMSVDKTYAYEGDKVGYTVQYRNYGTEDAKDVKIQTPLDDDYTFVSATKGGVYDKTTHTITWNIGTVKGFKTGGLAATMDSVAFTVRITSLDNSRVCETSTISGSNFDEWVSNEYPNHATYTMERNCVDVLANRSLVLEKTANRTEFNPNDKVTFTVNFENVSSDDAWMNGGRDNVRVSYGNYYEKGNAYQFYHLYRFWNDSYEAYINMNNYRVSYFMYDAAAQGLYNATSNPTGWTFVVDNQNDLDKYGYNPTSGPITFAYQKIPQGEDEYGKWNQRLMIRFADVLMAPSTHVYDKLDSQYLLHKGVWGPGFIRARLASNPNADLTTRVQDDWSFSTDITAGTIDGQGETFTLVTPCWANYDDLGYEIDNYSRHTCSSPTSKLKNFDRVLVEEFDGYTWRRIQGRGPLPGKEAYNVTIVDTIPKELSFDAFVTKKALGIEATYTAAPAGADYTGIVKWTIPEMLVGESGKLVYTCVAKDLGCPDVEDTYYINAAWIYSDTDSPDSSSVELMTSCTELPPYIEPQNSLFKTASQETAVAGDVISYEVKYVNTTGTIVDEDCSSTTNWMALGNGYMSSVSNGALKLNTNGSGAFFFGPKYSYGKDGAVYLSFTGSPYSTQELYFVMRYKSGTPGNSNFKGICMKLFINKDGKNNFGYELYNNGTLVKKEGSSWQDAIQFPGSDTDPVFKFVLNGDHLYMYINDAENEWTSVVKDWSGLSASDPGQFGMYVASNGNGNAAITNFRSELDYAFDIKVTDAIPSCLSNISSISGSGEYKSGTITWPLVAGPLAPNEKVSYTFDATVDECSGYINNYAYATVYGQDKLTVVNSIKCGATQCPDPPTASPIAGCVNEEITLTAVKTGSNTLVWYDSDKTTKLSSNKITKTTPGTYKYYVAQKGSCESDKTEVVVTVNETDAPTVSDLSYCKNQSGVSALSVEGTSITWYNDSKIELTAAPTPDVTTESTTTYYVTDTKNGCESDYAKIEVTVGALAKPTVDASVSYCQGATATALTATATGTNTLKWYDSKTATTALTSAPTPETTTVSSGKTYYVSQSTDACESERAEVTVVVKAKPTATISATADSYCGETSTVKLTLSSDVDLTDATYAWEKDETACGTTSSVTNATAGSYTCTITLDGCDYTTEAKTISQNDNPTYTITGAGSYCPESASKDPVVITFTKGKAPFTFTENVTGNNTSDESTYTITNPIGGTYKLTALTDANGCEMSETPASVDVVDLETPSLSVSSIDGVCAGIESVDISKYVTAGTGTVTYSTDKGSITSAGVLTGLTTAGEYTVSVKITGTTAPYCANTQTAKVTVFENPDITLNSTYSVCSETDLELAPTITGSSTYTYAWSEDGATKLNSTSLDKPIFNAKVTTDTDYDLKLTVTDKTTSCASSATTKVTTYALPTATLSSDETFVCSDAELAITAIVSGTGTGTWSNATKVSETSAKVDGSTSSVGKVTISYEYTDAHTCKVTATKDITVVAKPDKPAVTTISYCLNAVVTDPLTLVGVTNALWYGTSKTGTPSTTGPIPSTTTEGTTTYYVSQVVDGCESNQAELSVVIKDKLVPEIILSKTSVCKGTAIDVSLSQEYKSQTWSGTASTSLNSTTMSAPTFAATAEAGTYTLQVDVEDASGCTGTSDEVTITVNAIPEVSISATKTDFCISETKAQTISATILPNGISGDTFEWKGVDASSTKTSATFTPSANTADEHEITYQFESAAGCKSNVANLTMTVNALPTISVTPSKTDICVSGENSSDVTMTPSQTTGTFEYSVNKGTIATDGTLSASNGEGEYDITLLYTDANNCQNTATTKVTIHSLPEVKFSTSNPTQACYNSSAISLSVEPATTTAASYSFVGTTAATSADFNPATAAVGNNTISYIYNDANGCQNTATYDIEVVKVLAPTVDVPNPKTVTVDDGGVLLDVTTMTATPNVATDNLIWQDASQIQLGTGASYTSLEKTEGSYIAYVKEYRTINGKACYSDSTLATLVLSNCTAKSPIVENQKLCVGDNGEVTLIALYAGSAIGKKISWFSDKDLNTALQDDSEIYSTTVSTTDANVFTYYAAEYDKGKDCWSVPTTVTVTVNALPVIAINPIEYLCYADGSYTAIGSINGVASTAGTWSAKDDTFTVNAQTGVIDTKSAGETDGTYTLVYTYTDDNSCKNSVEEDFNIEYPNKPVSDGYLGIVSKPLTVEVSAKNTSLETGYSEVRWYASSSATTYNTGNSWQTGDDPATEHSTTYYLTQVVNGCESEKAEALVQIVSCPFAQPVVTSVVACKNDATLNDLQANVPTTTTVPADKWIWYDASQTELSSSTSNSFASGISTTTAATTTFYVGYLATEPTTNEQCPSPLTAITVTVNDLPKVEIVNPNKALCYEEGDVQISAKVNDVTNLTGTWTLTGESSGISASGIFNTKFKGEVDGNYELTYVYTDENTCSNSDKVTLQVEYPEVPTADNYVGLTSKPDPIVLTAKNIETDGIANWYALGIVKSTETAWTTIDDPTKAHDSKYQLSQTVNGCESEKINVLVSISDCPFAAPIPNSVEICQNETNVSDISATTTETVDNWIWYDANKNELSRGTNNSYATNVSTATAGSTSFYVSYLATDSNSGIQCESPVAEVTVMVNPLPEITFPTTNKTLVCYDGGDVVWSKNVDYHSNGVGTGTWKVNNVENNGMTSAGVFNPTTFGETTGMYAISYTYTDGKSCTNTATENITVQFTPVPEVSNHTSLVEQNAIVSISATPTDNSATISWYNASGKKLSNDNPFETGDAGNTVQNKSYYVTQTINTCESMKAEAKVLVIYCPVPKPNVIQPDDICNYDETPELVATLGDWNSRPTGTGSIVFNFYDEENATTPISSDLEGTFKPNIDKTKSGVYNYWVAEYNENVTPAACEGKRAKITLNVKMTALPTISSSVDAVCQYQTNPTFTGVGKGTIQWYESKPDYPAVGYDDEGVTFIPSASEVGVHSVWMSQTIDGCVSEAIEGIFEIKEIPVAPQTEDATVCELAEKETVCAISNDGSVAWYSNLNRTGLLAKTACYTPNVANAGTYTYYATQIVNGCESEVSEANYTVLPLPATPSVKTNSVSCDYDDVHTLSVAEKDGVTVAWYSSSDLDSQIATGNVYEHQITSSGTQRYYVRQLENGCVGNYTVASFVIVEKPLLPKVTDDEVCYGETANLSTDGVKDMWYSDADLNTLEGLGYTLSVSDVVEDQMLYVVREKSGCRSDVAEAKISVIPVPNVVITVDDEEATSVMRCEYDEEKPLIAEVSPSMGADDYVSWFIFPGNKTIEGSNEILLSDYVSLASTTTSSANYTVRVQYMVKNEHRNTYCASSMDTVKVITNSKARKPVVLSQVICQGEEIEPLYAFGTPNVNWISLDGILPVRSQGQRYVFASQQSNLEVGTYRFLVYDENSETGCHSDTVETEMTLAPAARTEISGLDSVCVGETAEYFTNFAEGSSYLWFVSGGNLNYSKDAMSTAVRYVDWVNPGIDTVVIYEQTWAGCQGYDTLVVKIADKPHAMFSWSLPGSSNVIELKDSTVQDSIWDITPTGERVAYAIPYTMYWNYGHAGSDNSIIDLEVPYDKRNFTVREGDYVYGYNCPTLTVENSFGCQDVYEYCIFINITHALFVPTAFAPANPAQDVRYFQPKGYNLKECEVSIYDKWGNLVWFSNEVENGMFVGKWDGKCNGKMMASDVYRWKMEATFIDGQEWEGFELSNGKKTKFGNVTLIR